MALVMLYSRGNIINKTSQIRTLCHFGYICHFVLTLMYIEVHIFMHAVYLCVFITVIFVFADLFNYSIIKINHHL